MSDDPSEVTQFNSKQCEPCLQAQSSASEDSLDPTGSPGPPREDRSSAQEQHSSPWTREGNCPKTTSEHSPSRIMEQSPSPSSSSSSFSLEQPIAGGTGPDPGRQMKSATSRSIRKRPHISDLQQHASTSRIPNEKHPAQSPNPLLTPPPKRRCASANAAVRAQSRFASPDRYVPQRPAFTQDCPSYRVSKPPSMLKGREKHTRSRDPTRNPFRAISDRSKEMARRRNGDNLYGLRPPHYTPSFVNGHDAAPFAVDPRFGAQAARQLSWGGFWTVGGRGAAQLGQLHAVQAGSAGVLASGTNAPMHTPTFLDRPTKDDMIQAHESRLALAMDIDEASRILQYTPTSIVTPRTPRSSTAGIKWEDNGWAREQLPRSERCHRPLILRPELR